jgi:hypothetical protein
MTRAEQAEAQAVRNVAEAIERTLRDAPNPASEASLWAALGPLGVTTRAQFDRALWTLEVRRVVRRAGGRLFSERG